MNQDQRTASRGFVPHSGAVSKKRRVPHSATGRRSPAAFTLVELLVVITIIAILAGLITAAAIVALATAKRTRIVAEINQFNGALEDYKNSVGSYPPNTQVDGPLDSSDGMDEPIDDNRVLANFRKHLKRVAPNHREQESLIRALCGLNPSGSNTDPDNPNLPGGMNAAEALVFWLGGFSDDPAYPISGSNGPSYSEQSTAAPVANLDPIEQRNWRTDVNVGQLGPRDNDNYFNADDNRFLIYPDPRSPDPGNPILRRINFWHLKAPSSPLPYVYFDASRGSSATAANDPPAITALATYSDDAYDDLDQVYAIKRERAQANPTEPFVFAGNEKFQILHGGIDERWGRFPRVEFGAANNLVADRLLFPQGPWTLDLADTIANFANGTLGDAQP